MASDGFDRENHRPGPMWAVGVLGLILAVVAALSVLVGVLVGWCV